MRKSFIFLSAFLGIILAYSCNSHIMEQPSAPEGDVDCIRFIVDDYRWDDMTKTQAQKQDGGLVFIWSEKDTVGIFPDSGAQAYFPVATGSGSNEAVFNGGGWALKKSHSYSAYYPYNKYNFENNKISIVYGTQFQQGNDNVDNLTDYDYMVSKMAVPEDGKVAFEFHHLNALVRFKLTVPEAAELTEFSIIAPESIFPTRQYLDLSGEEPVTTTTKTSENLNVKLADLTLTEAGEIIIYAFVPAINLSGKTLTLILKPNSGIKSYYANVEGKDFQAGKAYSYTESLSWTAREYVDLGLSVKWADRNVGSVVVENYGELFCWGETVPKTTGFNWETYSLCKGANNKLTKYCYKKDYGYNYHKDDLIFLDAAEDAATANWGENWRMPTLDELKELITKCTWTRATVKGINGYIVVGPSMNSIFLPAGGYGYRDDIIMRGTGGKYWSSRLDTDDTTIGPWANPDCACGIEFTLDDTTSDPGQSNSIRSSGRSIRPVYIGTQK